MCDPDVWGGGGGSSTLSTRYGVVCRQPSIVDVQILRVGQFVILCVPGEMTTMAGRRLRNAVADKVAILTLPFVAGHDLRKAVSAVQPEGLPHALTLC